MIEYCERQLDEAVIELLKVHPTIKIGRLTDWNFAVFDEQDRAISLGMSVWDALSSAVAKQRKGLSDGKASVEG